MFDWLSQNTDLVALLLAVMGLALGLFTVWLSVHQSRINAYTRMHETLISPDASAGRRKLFMAYEVNNLPEPGDEDWGAIDRSMATYDTLGVYVKRGIVPKNLVMSAWFHPLSNIAEPARAWVEHRKAHGVKNPWPSLGWLLDQAERYHEKQGCCKDEP